MKSPHLLLAASLLVHSAFAATHAVLPGGSIQAKVDAAAPGDIVAIFGGTYPGDVTVNKAIRLVEVDGQDVTITGNVTFTGVTNAPPFEGFAVGSSGKGITITNTTGIVLNNIDARPGSGVTVNGTSKVGITGGYYSQISQDGGELVTTLTQVTGAFNTTINSLKTVAFRATVSENFNWSSKKAYIGYSSGRKFIFSGSNSKVAVLNSIFDDRGTTTDTMTLQGSNNKFQILNCTIKGSVWAYWGFQTTITGRGILIAGGNESYIINNYISQGMYLDPAIYNTQDWGGGDGIRAGDSNVTIYNNIIVGSNWAISAPFGAVVSNNMAYAYRRGTHRDGVVPTSMFANNPLFVSGQEPKIQSSSPCVNAGVNDPIYNDLDGSRNDIGPSGGCLFDPNGWTTTSPVVISFDLAPQQLLKGVDPSVNLSNGQAVSQP